MGILNRLRTGMMLFGIAMGLVFPVYAGFFVEFKPGMRMWFILGCVVAGIVVGAFSYFLVQWILLKKLALLAIRYKEVSEGHLNVKCEIESNDAVGDIAHGFNHMIDSIRDLVRDLTQNNYQFTELASRLNRISNHIKKTTQQQGMHISHIASATSQAVTSQEEINRNLSDSVDFSKDISEHGRQTIDMLTDALMDAETNQESMDETIRQMEVLDQHSRSIGEILSLIVDIADQTNLLALNAAIEAARAGEQGRGFAVVADEVRKLAEKTTSSTSKIDEMLRIFVDGVQQSIMGIKVVSDATKEHNEKVASSANNEGEILEMIKSSSNKLDNIYSATSQQAHAYTDISSSMEKIDSAFNDIRSSAEDLASSFDQVNKLVIQQMAKLDRFKSD